MKTFKTVLLSTCLIMAFYSCSSNDDGENPDGQPQTNNDSYITYSLNGGGVLNGTNLRISRDDDTEDTFTITTGHVYFEETDLGNEKLVSLIYGYIGPNDEERSVELTFSAGTGSKTLGEFQTGSTGLITFHPTQFMRVSVDEDNIFYDHNNDMVNDASNNLLSKNIIVNITEYEETTNDLGILTLSHIKGNIGNSGNQLFTNYYTGPTSDPGELFCNISADFEYNMESE